MASNVRNRALYPLIAIRPTDLVIEIIAETKNRAETLRLCNAQFSEFYIVWVYSEDDTDHVLLVDRGDILRKRHLTST